MFKVYINGILATLGIAIGGCAYLTIENKYIGALLFSIALIAVCVFEFSLFTSKIGGVLEDFTVNKFLRVLCCLLGNITGCVIFGLIASLVSQELISSSVAICQKKLTQPIISTIVRGFFCGSLIYIAVRFYKQKDNFLGILISIPTFILSGFEHSIADMFYFVVSGVVSLQVILYLGFVIVGNSVGALIIPLLEKLAKIFDKKENKA